MLLYAPHRLRSQIAPLAKTPLWKRLLAMDVRDLPPETDKLGDALRARVSDPMVALAYLEVAPLLQERQAIGRVLEANPEWAETVPEVLTINEAISLAIKERHLTPSQTGLLRTLLEAPPPMS
ncbi:MAG TPA: hypothetical protein DCY18_14210 [Thauera sp.]|nr:hypothetical protein [Thauera sp.]